MTTRPPDAEVTMHGVILRMDFREAGIMLGILKGLPDMFTALERSSGTKMAPLPPEYHSLRAKMALLDDTVAEWQRGTYTEQS